MNSKNQRAGEFSVSSVTRSLQQVSSLRTGPHGGDGGSLAVLLEEGSLLSPDRHLCDPFGTLGLTSGGIIQDLVRDQIPDLCSLLLSFNKAVSPAVSLGQRTSPAWGVLGVAVPSSNDALDGVTPLLSGCYPGVTSSTNKSQMWIIHNIPCEQVSRQGNLSFLLVPRQWLGCESTFGSGSVFCYPPAQQTYTRAKLVY